MALLDRTLPPQPGPLRAVSLPSYEEFRLSNGIPVYLIPFGQVEVVTLKCIFKAGKGYQDQIGLANLTAENMPEGTASFSGYELAKQLDTYGTWIGNQTGYEQISFQLSTLSKYLPETLGLLKEVLFSPQLSEEEFNNLSRRKIQKLTVEAEKTRFHAVRLFGHSLFGEDHPYGMHLGKEEIQDLRVERIRQYHTSHFYPGNFFITLVGNINPKKAISHLEQTFGRLPIQPALAAESLAEQIAPPPTPQRIYHHIDGLQSTLRIGHSAFSRKHPDYYGMQVLNTVLGGYFGSRLMQNIREEKGYTYGISSGWISLRHSGFFVIQTDVGNEYVEATLTECKQEIQRLQQDLIPANELDLVKNYLLGRSLSERETPFQISDLLRFSLVNQLSFSELDRRFEVIKEISGKDLRDLAQKYLQPDQLVEVVVGG